jgi:hypothetical protein
VPSYSPVFSSQFILYTDPAPNTEFDVPSGFTAVIRDFTFYTSVGDTVSQLAIQDSGSAPQVVCAQLSGTGVNSYAQWQGRVVVPAGGIITLYPGEVGFDQQMYVGGYLLRNTLT